VWYVDFDPQTGREQGRRRPALVISNEQYNSTNNGLFIVAPITGTYRRIPVHVPVESGIGGLTKTSYVMCDQAGPKSDLRFIRYMGVVPDDLLLAVRRIVGQFIDAHRIY
jgi:mRNA interferase MazF